MIDVEARTISGGFALVGICAFAMATVIARRSRVPRRFSAMDQAGDCYHT